MSLPNVFANVTELDTPALDANFNALGALTVIPCLAVGTNAITLTPLANTPTIAAYSNNAPIFGFQAAATTSTTPVTAQVGTLPALQIYKANGAVAIGANDFLIGNTYYIAYNAALNSNAGGFVVVNPGSTAATAGAVQSAFKNLIILNGGTATTQMNMTADSVAVSDGATNFTTLFSVNVTISSGTTGANGLDTGTLAVTAWYALYIIYNPNTLTVAGLMSLSFTTPTLPSGYTQFARLGAARTDGSKNFYNIKQKNRHAQYILQASGNTTGYVNLASGSNSSTNTATSVAAIVPTAVADEVILSVGCAPSSSINVTSNVNGTFNGNVTNTVMEVTVMPGSAAVQHSSRFMLESVNVYYGSNGASNRSDIVGWIDNI